PPPPLPFPTRRSSDLTASSPLVSRGSSCLPVGQRPAAAQARQRAPRGRRTGESPREPPGPSRGPYQPPRSHHRGGPMPPQRGWRWRGPEVVIKNLLAIRIAALGSLAHPVQDHRANRGGLLVARVVVGDEDGVGDLRSLLAHHGALVVIAVAASSQHDADATCRRRQVVAQSPH